MVRSHRLSRGPNDGSRDDMRDNGYEHELYDKDQRADTRTTYFRSDVERLQVSERRKRRLRRMLRRQEGENPGETYYQSRNSREQQNRSEWKRRIVSSYASHVELTRAQKERAKHLVNDVLDINTFGHYSTEEVVLGVINVVAREDGRFIEDERQFRDLMVDVGITTGKHGDTPDMNTMKSLRRLVRERLPSR